MLNGRLDSAIVWSLSNKCLVHLTHGGAADTWSAKSH